MNRSKTLRVPMKGNFITKDLCRLRNQFSTAIYFCVFSLPKSEKMKPDSHPLTHEAMFFSTDFYKCFCLDCSSANCITHICEDCEDERDYYGECLDCGSLSVEWEMSPVLETGVAA